MWGRGRGWGGDTREGSLLKVINKLVGEPGADLGLLGLAGVGDVLISFLDLRHLCLFIPYHQNGTSSCSQSFCHFQAFLKNTTRGLNGVNIFSFSTCPHCRQHRAEVAWFVVMGPE